MRHSSHSSQEGPALDLCIGWAVLWQCGELHANRVAPAGWAHPVVYMRVAGGGVVQPRQ